jgi:hypothetical protein
MGFLLSKEDRDGEEEKKAEKEDRESERNELSGS